MDKIKDIVRKIFGDKVFAFLITAKRNFLKKHYQLKENTRIFMKKIQALLNKKYRNNLKTTINTISSYKDKEYARVDDPDNGKPGYFTLKTN